MGNAFKHALLGGMIGLAAALLGWAASEGNALGPALAIGIAAGGFAGASAGFWQRRGSKPARPQPAATPAHGLAAAAKSSTRRRQRDRLLARACGKLRWRALTAPLAQLLRAPKANLIGKSVYHRLHPADVPAVDAAFTQARAERRMRSTLCRFLIDQPAAHEEPPPGKSLRSDTKILPPLEPASFVYVRLEIRGQRDRAGRVSRFLCRFVDLTEAVLQREKQLQLARKELTAANKRLRTVGRDLARLKLSYRELYQHAPVMYFSLNIEGKLVTFNDTLLETLGYERHELQNRNYTDLLCPAALQSYVTISRNMPAHAGERETQWRKKDGTLIDVWLHTVPVYDEFGRFVRSRSAALDVTEKSRLANELRARGGELERTNQRLRTINSELEAFTHVVSHDLKEPLRTLQAYSHLLAEEHAARLGADGFQYVNHLVRASRRLGALIDELLNLSQAGRITRAPTAFSLIQIVATVRQDLVSLIQRKDASILTDGSLPDVSGDPVRITQLLSNLVANGLKYNQNPAPAIVIGASTCADDSARVTVFVRDNGIGIDPAFHQQIFGIFRRLHQAEDYEGTGAGLAICKKIVEAHGGRIWVESAPGQGATFFFTLPRAVGNGKLTIPAAPGESPSAARTRQPLPAAAVTSAGARLVLVDDQSDVGLIIQKLGRRDGLDVRWFPTAEEAWPHLQEHHADLILLDVNLPGMSGVDLCRKLRGFAKTAQTPVALFTPDQDADKLETLRRAGVDFFLTKDLLCEPSHWQQKIQELLGQIRAEK